MRAQLQQPRRSQMRAQLRQDGRKLMFHSDAGTAHIHRRTLRKYKTKILGHEKC